MFNMSEFPKNDPSGDAHMSAYLLANTPFPHEIMPLIRGTVSPKTPSQEIARINSSD